MAKRVMDRRAADNKYLHRDFHVSGDLGIQYVGERYGDNGVKNTCAALQLHTILL